ncbi:M20/M25/M40 family metallo-hydrolase [Emticicia sp. 21SJ11W-3]|uniref:M20/M25/M40 family metallo-hydrolase n=1 Tax=Emticicia sp. 21SJ11W-3 TaxID=2916755 RepID=UPI0020A1CE18|nr:M20/M25/M40 family metallo-hydrolase [Emticicia sp. 21SJ11W-3]UTA69211.1 M20/M25/M40 family metallo-hydrolase [Emticicia sp. 21SJ11W-3]
MKFIRLTLLLFAFGHAAMAQKVNKLIKETEVKRIISTLAADDMMGRSSLHPQQIEKATAFIAEEFKKAGLKPLNGLSGYRQEFPITKIDGFEKAEVIINGQVLTKDKYIFMSDKEEVNWTSNIPVVIVGKEDTFTPNQFMNDSTSKIVLVDAVHEGKLAGLKRFFGRTRLLAKPYPKIAGNILFVVGFSSADSYSVKIKQRKEAIKMANVVGLIPGKSKPDEMVVFSGHYDHLGIIKSVEGDSIANGADDDASGTTAVIALANYFKKLKNNERTIVFAAFTAEEIGGFGSKYFSEQLNPDKVVAMFNIEMIGKASKWGINSAFITGFERSDFGAILQKNLKGTAFTFNPDPYPQQNLFYRSDNATLARLGVPAHTISTDQIDSDKLYHSVNDEVESLDIQNILATIRAIALSSQSIIAGTDTPTRIDKSTVK